MVKKTVIVLMAAGLLAGCGNTYGPDSYGPKQTAGTLLGAVAGGLAGAQFGRGSGNLAATAVGTLLGAYLGSEVGKSLDKADQMYAQQAEIKARTAPIGQQITWDNPQSGHSGSFTPTRAGYDEAGNYCREYQTTVTIGGQTQKAYGTACRQPDGSWKMVK